MGFLNRVFGRKSVDVASVDIDGTVFEAVGDITVEGDRLAVNGSTVAGGKGRIVEVRILRGTVGGIRSTASVSAGTVAGDVRAGGAVNCGSVGGSVTAGGTVNCEGVRGSVKAEGSVNCDAIGGRITAGGDVVGGSRRR